MIDLYLEEYIGHHVTFELTDQAKDEKLMKSFYKSDKNPGYIRNKLIATDQLGLWVQGFKETTTYFDDDMIELIEPRTEMVTYHVLVRWEYIRGVFVVENPSKTEKKIGFLKESNF